MQILYVKQNIMLIIYLYIIKIYQCTKFVLYSPTSIIFYSNKKLYFLNIVNYINLRY